MTTQPSNDDNVFPMAPKMTISIVMVTPAMAKRWLAQNTANRKLRKAKANQYTNDMAAGRWTFDANAICFNSEGQLQNGQHRLTAVVNSGMTIPFTVARNVPDEAMKTMDTGAKRTAADYFGMEGRKNAHLTASAAKFALIYSDGRVYKDRGVQAVSTTELHDFIEANPDLITWVDVAQHHAKSIDAPPTVIAVAGWLFARHAGPEASARFLERLASRANLGAGHPILALDARLRAVRNQRRRLEHREFLSMFIKAWNYDRKSVTKVAQINTPKPGDRIPEVLR